MNLKLLVPLCAATALLVACGRTDTQATSEDAGSRIEMMPETDAATSTTDNVPGTPSTPSTPEYPAEPAGTPSPGEASGDAAAPPPAPPQE